MKASVNNFRGCISAEFDINDKPVFIMGDNGHGKTSIAHALVALLTGDTIPTDLITKADSQKIITDGKKNGRIRLESDVFSAEINYPEAELQTTGEPPSASPIACGIDSILFMNQKKRGEVISKYLEAEPTESDLMEAFKTAEIKYIPKIWETIQGLGWDSAHKNAEKKGSELKGSWKYITQDNYGAKKILHWLPKGWDYSLEKMNEAALEKEVQDRQAWVESAIKSEAVNESKIEELETSIKTANENLDDPENLKKLIENFKINKASIQKKLEKLPTYTNSTIMICPKCNSGLLQQDNELILVPGKINKERIDAMNNEIKLHQKNIREADQEILKIEGAIRDYGTDKQRIAGLERQLTLLNSEKQTPSDKSVEDCRQDLEKSQTRLKMFQDKKNADKFGRLLELNQKILKILSPSGLRRDKILACLKDFNIKIDNISNNAGWLPIVVAEDYSVTYAGRICGINPERSFCSASEWFKAKTVLQHAMADIDKSSIVLVDGAEILMKEGRKGLLRISKPGTLCFISMNTPDEITKKLRELVNCNWIDKGELKKLG